MIDVAQIVNYKACFKFDSKVYLPYVSGTSRYPVPLLKLLIIKFEYSNLKKKE